MSNRSFDTLCKQQEIAAAKRTICEYGRHLVRTDLSAEDVAFLTTGFQAQKDRLVRAKVALSEWWM